MNPRPDRNQPRHPIGVVCRRTGLKPDLVRAWERRYGAVKPGRSGGEQRLYSDADLERLLLLRQATLAGRSIGQIASLGDEELRNLVNADTNAAVPSASSAPAADLLAPLADACLAAIRQVNAERLQQELQRAAAVMSGRQVLENLLAPLLESVGELWHDGRLRPVHEHLAVSVIKSFALDLLRRYRPAPGAPVILTTTPPGHLHEIGALFAAVVAAGEGWNATYLGPNLPVDDVVLAARERDARVVAVSATYPADGPELLEPLRRLRRELGRGRTLIAGGRALAAHATELAEIGAQHAPTLTALRTLLDSTRASEGQGLSA